VQAPSSGELDLGERDRDLFSVAADRLALTCHKSNVVLIRRDDPALRDRTTAQVTSKILEDLSGILARLRWWLNVTYPGSYAQVCQQLSPFVRQSQWLEFTIQLQCVLLMQALKPSQEDLTVRLTNSSS